MYLCTARTTLKAAALMLAVVLAPAANAVPESPAPTTTRHGVTLSRDTGVGLQIAAQGNEALRQIKAELQAKARAWLRPRMPAARVVRMSQPAGRTNAVGPSIRAAK